ncbi:hypothetical protein ARMGADRAFT_156914 [Armillaria gallica]|uniref:Uncharacterized protein n=1 Tax=Armillaria gallica TaxID=47427 RepID=A0A2H3DR31_ARMGA|nr:hypothetical protein ARMGADRAFT_156914 [Armillaria gallica]
MTSGVVSNAMWWKRSVSRIIFWLCDPLSGNGCSSHIHKVAAEFHRHFLPQTKVRPPLEIMRLIATKATSIWRSHLALIVRCPQFGSRRISRSQPNMKQAFTRLFSRHARYGSGIGAICRAFHSGHLSVLSKRLRPFMKPRQTVPAISSARTTIRRRFHHYHL